MQLPAEAKATDARKRFQFDTSVAPDASKVVSPECSGHIALRRTDGFLCEKLRLVRHRMQISGRQNQVLKSVSSPPGGIRGEAARESRIQQSNLPQRCGLRDE